jgi:hypothetical protein
MKKPPAKLKSAKNLSVDGMPVYIGVEALFTSPIRGT